MSVEYGKAMMLKFGLDLAEIAVPRLSQFAEIALRQGCSFTTLRALENERERVYWLHQECRKRQPPLETHQEPQDYGLWGDIWAGPQAHPELYYILRSGRGEYIGVSGLVRAETAGEFVCGFTGIVPESGGRGLALALKSCLLLGAKTAGIRHIQTSVRPDNTSMLRLNAKLGFVLRPEDKSQDASLV